MTDLREEILNQEHDKLIDDRGFPRDGGELIFAYKPAAISAMDEYGKILCLELIQWMLNKGLFALRNINGQDMLYYRGEYITPEQLFENFL